jgi:hypothetical protein
MRLQVVSVFISFTLATIHLIRSDLKTDNTLFFALSDGTLRVFFAQLSIRIVIPSLDDSPFTLLSG